MGKRQKQTEVRKTRAHSNRGEKHTAKACQDWEKPKTMSELRSVRESNTHVQPDNDPG